MYRYLAGAVVAAFLLSGGPVSAQDKLTVFWGKGFYKAEDDALFAAVKKFERRPRSRSTSRSTRRRT
jgi:multiple sugar transport system substrate-binding protein